MCDCDAGWGGADCAFTEEVLASIVQLRSQHLQMQAQSLTTADLVSPEALSQQAQTLASIAQPDQLVPESRSVMFDIVNALVSASQSSSTEMRAETGLSLLTVVSNAAFVSIQQARVAVYAAAPSNSTASDRKATGGSGAQSRSLRLLSTTSVEAIQDDARQAADQMVSTVNSISRSLMKGAVAGEEPLSISAPTLDLQLQRLSVSDTSAALVTAASGSALALPPLSAVYSNSSAGTGSEDRTSVDVRAVAWASNPHGWSSDSLNISSLVSTFELTLEDGSVHAVHSLATPIALSIKVPSYVAVADCAAGFLTAIATWP